MKDIIRFKRTGGRQLIHRNITQEQAKEWCSSPLTHKEGKWFDGFADTGTYHAQRKPKYAVYHTPVEGAV